MEVIVNAQGKLIYVRPIRIYQHPKYQKKGRHDLAMIELSRNLRFRLKLRKPVELAESVNVTKQYKIVTDFVRHKPSWPRLLQRAVVDDGAPRFCEL